MEREGRRRGHVLELSNKEVTGPKGQDVRGRRVKKQVYWKGFFTSGSRSMSYRFSSSSSP